MYTKKNKNSIKNLFNSISHSYDFVNNLMSFGLHKFIKKLSIENAIKISRAQNNSKLKILDLCTGTGDMAILLGKMLPNCKIVAVDFSENMLSIARKKAKELSNIEFLSMDIFSMPFEENTFDMCFISFGLRNTSDIQVVLKSINSILKPNGTLSILDLGKPSRFIKPFFNFYFNKIIPLLDFVISLNGRPYNYLKNSVIDYPSQDELSCILRQNNYHDIHYHKFLSGIIVQHLAKK